MAGGGARKAPELKVFIFPAANAACLKQCKFHLKGTDGNPQVSTVNCPYIESNQHGGSSGGP